MRPTLFPLLFSFMAHSGRRALLCATFALGLGLTLSAEAQEYTKNQPDQALRSDARVDPSTLGMSLSVPLGGAPGRAGASLPISLRYSSKLWRMETGPSFQPYNNATHTSGYPKFSENSIAGWTSSLEPPRIELTGEEQMFGSTGKPLGGSIDDPESYTCYVRRVHLHLPDGSSHELRKDDSTPCSPSDSPSSDYSGMYYAVDGSRTRYDYDAGVLYLPDGSRYFFAPYQYFTRYGNYVDGRWGTTYIDRHGNTMSYNMGTGVWTDTLGRTFSNPLRDDPQANQIQEYQVPGVNGHVLIYKLHWKSLGDALRLSDTPHYTSTNACVGTNSYPAVPSPGGLFNTSSTRHVCAGTDANGNLAVFNPVVLAKIELPNGQSYEFKYNVWGEIEQVRGPGGGYERFGYAQVASLSRANPPYDQTNRGVVERWVSPSGTGVEETTHHWLYSITKSTDFVTATTTEPDGTRSERLIYANSFGTQYGFETPLAGMTYDERVYNASNQMLRRTLTGWSTITPPGSTRPRDPHVTKTVGLMLDTGGPALASTATMAYDGDLNVTAKNSYDYYTSVDPATAQTGAISDIPDGTLARRDETTYLVNDQNIPATTRDAYRARNLVGLPSSTRVKKGVVVVTQSEVKYDEAAYPLLTYTGTVTGWADPGTGVRGNATTIRSWLDTSNTWIETHARYDQAGNVRYAWDAGGNLSEVEYASAYHYAYPTHTLSAIPDPTNTRGTNAPLESWTAYDFSTGKVTSTTDANNQTTHLSYQDDNNVADPLDRLRKAQHPDGGWVKYFYNDTPGNLYVRTLTAMNATQSVESYQFFDGLGRGVRSFTNEGGSPVSFITSDTQYDALGRVWRVSNPYRTNGSNDAVNPSGFWTTTAYDALGRVSTVTTPDNAVVSTSYTGNEVTVTDQAGQRRKSVTDALGRLTTVYEDPHATGYTGFNYRTDYSYDAPGNLRKVDQGGQLRYFMYDSLGRLIRAKNPEQGNFTPDPDFP
jgi:YD repeat-containing protein